MIYNTFSGATFMRIRVTRLFKVLILQSYKFGCHGTFAMHLNACSRRARSSTHLADCLAATSSFDAASSIPEHHPLKPHGLGSLHPNLCTLPIPSSLPATKTWPSSLIPWSCIAPAKSQGASALETDSTGHGAIVGLAPGRI